MRALVWMVVGCAGVAWADDPKPVSDRAKQQVAEELVEKLGSRDFKERDEAEKKLVAMGGVVAGVVKRGLKSDSLEVAARCERILPKLRTTDVQQPDHPVLKRFLGITGDTPRARGYYAEMVGGESRLAVVERLAEKPDAAEPYKVQLDALVEQAGKIPERWRGGRGAEPTTLPPAVRPIEEELVFFLFLGSFADTAAVEPAKSGEAGWVYEVLVNQACQGVVSRRMNGLPEYRPHPEIANLVAAWAARRPKAAGRAVVAAAFTCERPGFAAVVREAIQQAKLSTTDKCAAAEYLGRFGSPADVPALSELFGDEASIAADSPNHRLSDREVVSAEVRDVARAAAVRVLGHDPADVGFEWWNKLNGRVEQWRANEVHTRGAVFARAGFASDDARKAATAAVDELIKLRGNTPNPRPTRPFAVWPSRTALLTELPLRYTAPQARQDPFTDDVRQVMSRGYSDDDDAPVYFAAATVAARDHTPQAYQVAQKYVGEGLARSRDTGDRADGHLTLARLVLRMNEATPADRPAGGVRREMATKHLLDAYGEVLKVELPAKRPDVPEVKPLGNKPTAKERAEFAVANTARREARYVCDLIDARDDVVKRLRELFKGDPEELAKLAEKKLPKEAVEALMKAVR